MAGEQLKNVSDMMRALQNEIEKVKAGDLSESTARVVFQGRKLQLQAAALNLQFMRLNKGRQPEELQLQAPSGEPEKS